MKRFKEILIKMCAQYIRKFVQFVKKKICHVSKSAT